MKMLLFFGMLLPCLANAQIENRSILETRVVEAMREARQAVNNNLQRMDERELRQVARKLEDVSALARGQGGNTQPTPIPRPQPVPTYYACADDNSALFQTTFTKIKEMAYSPSGLDLTNTLATEFAQEWTKRHACNVADLYIREMLRLRAFAYSSTGLNLTRVGAADYAKSQIGRVCVEMNYETIFQNHYNFAYSQGGLNMTSIQSRNYAQPKMEAQAMNCNSGL